MPEPVSPRARTLPRLVFILIAAGAFVTDQVTKSMVERRIPPYEVIPVVPHFFNLTMTKNPGAAFGLFADSPTAWKTAFLVLVSSVLIAAVVGVVWRSRKLDWPTGVGFSLILGGAISNLVDRIRFGRVVDFIDLYVRSYHWYTFNLADTGIVLGAFLLIYRVLFTERNIAVEQS